METVSDNPEVQASYEAMRRDGVSHKLAEMLALRQGPGLVTDTRFSMGHHTRFEGDEQTGARFKRMAERQGVSVEGASYKGQLAAYPGDPEAWVRDRGDVKRLCEKRNYNCDGAVKVAAREVPISEPAIALDIIEDGVANELANNPGIEKDVPISEIKEKFIKKHKPHWH